jgi:hypothetical protein
MLCDRTKENKIEQMTYGKISCRDERMICVKGGTVSLLRYEVTLEKYKFHT